MRSIRNSMACTVFLLAPTILVAGPIPERFSLGKFVPDDSWMYLNFAANPETKWLDESWAEVWTALKDSGIDREVTTLVLSMLDGQQRSEAEAGMERASALLKGVNWSDIVNGRELVFAERVTGKLPGYDYIALAHVTPGTGPANFAGLSEIMRELAALNPDVKFVNKSEREIESWMLHVGGDPITQQRGFTIALMRKGDVLGLVSGRKTISDVFDLMNGDQGAKPIASLPRLHQALAEVPAPEDALLYFDIRMLINDLDQMMTNVTRGRDVKGEGQRVMSVIRKALSQCDVMDYAITTVEHDGRQMRRHTVSRIQPGKEKSDVAAILLDRQPFERFDRHVPADALGFYVGGFINLERAYKTIVEFIEKELPDGAEYIATWKKTLAAIGFDPQRDVFDWWSGEVISVSLPAAAVTPWSREDSVIMLRVKNSELAAQKINGAIDTIAGLLKQQGQMLSVAPAASVKREGFREITHPVMAMFLRPVVGVSGDWLIISTSGAAINKCLAVAAGEAPSILGNERFKKEGLAAKGPVLSASFKDTSRYGDELAEATAAIGMVGGMLPMIAGAQMGPNAPRTDEVKALEAMQKLFSLVTKLGPVLQKIDFYSSDASLSVLDGALIRDTQIVTYKDPEARTAKAAGRP